MPTNHALTPYLAIREAARAIEYYQKVFGATQVMRLEAPDGQIGHAEIEIEGSRIMLSDEFPEMNVRSPLALGGSPVSLHLYVADVDAVYSRAVAAGAKAERPPVDEFYGDRAGSLIDPFGHRWFLATHKQDVSAEEMQRRYDAMSKA
jgi:PhnB protein